MEAKMLSEFGYIVVVFFLVVLVVMSAGGRDHDEYK